MILDSAYNEAILDVAGETGCRRVIRRNPDQVFVVEMENDHVVRDARHDGRLRKVSLRVLSEGSSLK